jgi:nitrate/nitrite transporter NarK
MKKKLLKSIGVILLGFVITGLLSVITDFLLEATGILPDPKKGLFETSAIIVVLFYRGIYTIFAGYVVAKFAPYKPITHALILGVIGTLITVAATNNPSLSGKAPLWFGYTLAITIIPCMWLGVKIQEQWKNEWKNASRRTGILQKQG